MIIRYSLFKFFFFLQFSRELNWSVSCSLKDSWSSSHQIRLFYISHFVSISKALWHMTNVRLRWFQQNGPKQVCCGIPSMNGKINSTVITACFTQVNTFPHKISFGENDWKNFAMQSKNLAVFLLMIIDQIYDCQISSKSVIEQFWFIHFC